MARDGYDADILLRAQSMLRPAHWLFFGLALALTASYVAAGHPANAPRCAACVADDPADRREQYDRFLDTHAGELAEWDRLTRQLAADPSMAPRVAGRLAALRPCITAFDRLSGQKDAWASRLYWFESWEAAQAESRRTGKPILALRMLGRLDEDASCANSRYFRTTLYAHPQIADRLRNKFVLFWHGVRPVPILTVQLDADHVLRRPIVGNSYHAIVSSDGDVQAVLPGLTSAETFLAFLDAPPPAAPPPATETAGRWKGALAYGDAHCETKTSVESTSLKYGGAGGTYADTRPTGDPAALAFPLHPRVVEMIRIKAQLSPCFPTPGPVDSRTDEILLAQVRMFQSNIQADDAINRGLQGPITERLRAHPEKLGRPLDEWMYKEVFKMDLGDPWLGLDQPEHFMALDGDGLLGSRGR